MKFAAAAVALVLASVAWFLFSQSPDAGAEAAGAAPFAASEGALAGRADLEVPEGAAPVTASSRAVPFQRPKGKITRARVWSDDPVEPEPVQLEFFALDDKGEALVDAELALAFNAGREGAGFAVASDGLGRVETPLFLPGAMEGPIKVRVGLRAEDGEGLIATAEREFDALVPGLNRLGDFRLQTPSRAEAPLLVTGRVLDEAGRGIEGVAIVWERGVWDRSGAGSAAWPGVWTMTHSEPAPGAWGFAHVVPSTQSTRTDREGRFEIRGRTNSGLKGLTLIETRPPRGMPALDIPELPARDVVWRAEGRRRLSGQLRLPEGADPGLLQIQSSSALTDRRGQISIINPSEDGRFEGWIGETALALEAVACDDPSVRVALWQTEGDAEIEADLELGVIDLRESLRFVQVQLRDAAGQPLPGARLGVKPGHVSGSVRRYDTLRAADDAGRVELLTLATINTLEFEIYTEAPVDRSVVFLGGIGPYPVDEVPGVLVAE